VKVPTGYDFGDSDPNPMDSVPVMEHMFQALLQQMVL